MDVILDTERKAVYAQCYVAYQLLLCWPKQGIKKLKLIFGAWKH